MGLRLEVARRAVEPELTRDERRSWMLHRTLSSRLTGTSPDQWQPIIEGDLTRLREAATGRPQERNVARWAALIDTLRLAQTARQGPERRYGRTLRRASVHWLVPRAARSLRRQALRIP
jgi:hypothetical protein